jgi:ketosteroid isomerase-like protein
MKPGASSADISPMELRLLTCIGVLSLVGIATATLCAQEKDQNAAGPKIIALEHAWNLAESAGDLKALDALFDNELIYVDVDGSLMNKTQLMAHIKSVHPQQVTTELMTVQVFDDTAIVNGSYRSNELKNGKPIVRRGRFTDTWVYKNFTWVCITAQATPILE